jgi:HPt (histidine-containing phosphotransfer) domain-containing protein
MDGYITKPILAEELYQALASYESRNAPPEQPTGAPQPAEVEETRPTSDAGAARARRENPSGILDKAALLARMGGREDRMRTILQIFLEESSRQMDELRDAITRGDAMSLQRLAHSLKGAVGIVGAQSVVDAAVTLETLGLAGELTGAAQAFTVLDQEFSRLKSELNTILAPAADKSPS